MKSPGPTKYDKIPHAGRMMHFAKQVVTRENEHASADMADGEPHLEGSAFS